MGAFRLLLLLAAVGCGDDAALPDAGGADAGIDAGGGEDAGQVGRGCGEDPDVPCCSRYVLEGGTGGGARPDDPAGSITAMIAELAAAGGGLVCVGVAAPERGACAANFSETFAMAEGVSVEGALRAGPDFERDDDCTTVLRMTEPDGITFGPEVTGATSLTGFTILGFSLVPRSVGVMIAGDGVLENNVILGGEADLSIGVYVMGGAPTLRRNVMRGDEEVDTSIGLLVEGGSPRVVGSPEIRGGDAGTASWGIHAISADALEVFGNFEIEAGEAPISRAIHLESIPRVLIANNIEIHASPAGTESTAVLVDGCAGGLVRFESNENIVGGGGGETSFGIHAIDCDLEVFDTDMLIGALYRTGIGVGLRCEGEGRRCTVDLNGVIGVEEAATEGAGVEFLGGATGDVNATMFETCLPAANAVRCSAITYQGAPGEPLLTRNRIMPSYASEWTAGIFLADTAAVVINNIVEVDGGSALEVRRTRAGPQAMFHSNTFVRNGAGRSRVPSAVVRLLSEPGLPPSGFFRNNIISCLATWPTDVSLARSSSAVLPTVFESNALSGCALTAVTLDDGATMDRLDALESELGAAGVVVDENVDYPPVFRAPPANYMLAPGSPLIDIGNEDPLPLLPIIDFWTDDRPMDSGWDIGADEYG